MNGLAERGIYVVYNYRVPLQDRRVQIVNKVQINKCVLSLRNAGKVTFPSFFCMQPVWNRDRWYHHTFTCRSKKKKKTTHEAVSGTFFFVHSKYLSTCCLLFVCETSRKLCTLPWSNLGDLRQKSSCLLRNSVLSSPLIIIHCSFTLHSSLVYGLIVFLHLKIKCSTHEWYLNDFVNSTKTFRPN